MKAKDYLRTIKRMDSAIEHKRIELKMLEESRGAIGSVTDYTRDKVQTSPNGASFTTLSDKIVDLKQEIEKQIITLNETRSRIIDQINSLDDPNEAQVLFKRYVMDKSMEMIAVEMNYSYVYTCKINGRGLISFEEKFLKGQ